MVEKPINYLENWQLREKNHLFYLFCINCITKYTIDVGNRILTNKFKINDRISPIYNIQWLNTFGHWASIAAITIKRCALCPSWWKKKPKKTIYRSTDLPRDSLKTLKPKKKKKKTLEPFHQGVYEVLTFPTVSVLEIIRFSSYTSNKMIQCNRLNAKEDVII